MPVYGPGSRGSGQLWNRLLQWQGPARKRGTQSGLLLPGQALDRRISWVEQVDCGLLCVLCVACGLWHVGSGLLLVECGLLLVDCWLLSVAWIAWLPGCRAAEHLGCKVGQEDEELLSYYFAPQFIEMAPVTRIFRHQ